MARNSIPNDLFILRPPVLAGNSPLLLKRDFDAWLGAKQLPESDGNPDRDAPVGDRVRAKKPAIPWYLRKKRRETEQ